MPSIPTERVAAPPAPVAAPLSVQGVWRPRASASAWASSACPPTTEPERVDSGWPKTDPEGTAARAQ